MGSQGKQTLVIQHGTLLDGTGSPPTLNQAMVIEGNRITHIGPLPEDPQHGDGHSVEIIDATGKWIMPGLIDGHCHLSFGFPQISGGPSTRGTTSPGFSALRAARNAQQVLRSGVTSVAVPGGTWFNDVAIREAIAVGLIEGPRIACAGRFIVTYGGPGISTDVLALNMWITTFQQHLVSAGAGLGVVIFVMSFILVIPYTLYAFRKWFT